MKQSDQFASRAEAIRYYTQRIPYLEETILHQDVEIARLKSVIAGHRKVINHYLVTYNTKPNLAGI